MTSRNAGISDFCRFGFNTFGSCGAWLQFPPDLVGDSKKSALNGFRYAAQVDASSAPNTVVISTE